MEIKEPTLVVDKERCKRNIATMVTKAKKNDLVLRPHFKTHQSVEIGKWFRVAGVEAITVSSIGMAKYFAEAGWKEITVAFPLNINMIDVVNTLAERIKLHVFINSIDVLNLLNEKLIHRLSAYIEIDSGSNRSGLAHDNRPGILNLVDKIEKSDKVNLKGFYSHAGHTYNAQSKDEIDKIGGQAKQMFLKVKEYLSDSSQYEFCWGDTPSCSLWESFAGIDAISPGNFVFYDVMQTQIGSCNMDQVAVALYCPVVQKKPDQNEVCVHGGAIHFSKDMVESEGDKIFGKLVGKDNWQPLSGSKVRALSQEHGIISLSKADFDTIEIGDVLAVLPIHSCLTAQAIGSYITKDGVLADHYAQKNRE